MSYIDLKNSKDKILLEQNNILSSQFESILDVVKRANQTFYHLNAKHEYFYEMLLLSDEELNTYFETKRISLTEKKEWGVIKDVKTGDSGYISRYLISNLKVAIPEICEQLIEQKHSTSASRKENIQHVALSDEIDALLLASNVPVCFAFLEQLSIYKEGVFNKLRKRYISFIENKTIHVICEFLRAYESNLNMLGRNFLNETHQENWTNMAKIVKKICFRADPNHHDPLGTHTINCLRSIYISIFNISMEWSISKGTLPLMVQKFLPIIPDCLDFTKKRLEHDNAWSRYQEHHFLFMRLPPEQKTRIEAFQKSITPAEKVTWMGYLGKTEIQAIILPMISSENRFKNLAKVCRETLSNDSEKAPFVLRVWKIMQDVYFEYLKNRETSSAELHQLFSGVEDRSSSKNDLDTKSSSPDDLEQKAIFAIRNLSFLVVDDSERILKMTLNILKQAGAQNVYEAYDGVQAFDIIKQNPIDVVLCDWIMPKMTGIELLKKVMQSEELALKVTFLMLTTVNDKASIIDALSSGARGYLIKPFTRQQLFEKVFLATEWLFEEKKQRDQKA